MNTPNQYPFLNNMLSYQGQDDHAIAARAHAVMLQRTTQTTMPPNRLQTPLAAGHPYAPSFHYQNAYGVPYTYNGPVPPRDQTSWDTALSSSSPEWTGPTYPPLRPHMHAAVAYDATQQFYGYQVAPMTPYIPPRQFEPLAQQTTSYPTDFSHLPALRMSSRSEFNFEDQRYHDNEEDMSLRHSAFAQPEPALSSRVIANKLGPQNPLFEESLASATRNPDDEGSEQRHQDRDKDEAMTEASQTHEARELHGIASTLSRPSRTLASASNPPSPSSGDKYLAHNCLSVRGVGSIQTDNSTCTSLLEPRITAQPTSTIRTSSSTAVSVHAQDLAELYCPQRVIDVWDAASFITHMASAPTPTTPFRPSNKKPDIRPVDRGHSRKHPIGELIIRATLADPYAAAIGEAILPNQDDKTFCLLNSVAAPACVGMPELRGSIEFTLVEAAAYFPTHFRREAFLRRLCRAGMTQGQIKSWINYFRQLDGASMLKGSIIGTTLDKWGKMRAPSNDARTTDFSAQHWTSDKEPINYPLLLLDLGVVHRPQGEDAGPLTILIEWCKDNCRYHTLLSEVPALLEELGLSKTIERPVGGGCPDQAAFARWKPTIERDRLRRTKPVEKAYEAERRTRRKVADV